MKLRRSIFKMVALATSLMMAGCLVWYKGTQTTAEPAPGAGTTEKGKVFLGGSKSAGVFTAQMVQQAPIVSQAPPVVNPVPVRTLMGNEKAGVPERLGQ